MTNMHMGALALALGMMGCGGSDSAQTAEASGGADAGVLATDSRQDDTGGGLASDLGGGGGQAADASEGLDAGVAPADLRPENTQDGLLACATKPAVNVADLSGTWVLRAAGAQVVTADRSVFHMKSVKVALVNVTQAGDAVTLDGHVCDRFQEDDPNNPAKVVIPDAWRKTEWPFKRSGTFSAGTLTLPNAVDVVGASLANPTTDKLPTDKDDPRLVDDDKDGQPGITINLTGTPTGSLYCAQRDQSTLAGVTVAADRVEGGMTYVSDQSVVDSKPSGLKTLYSLSKSNPDPTACSSSFVMVRVADTATCEWVRDNENTLF